MKKGIAFWPSKQTEQPVYISWERFALILPLLFFVEGRGRGTFSSAWRTLHACMFSSIRNWRAAEAVVLFTRVVHNWNPENKTLHHLRGSCTPAVPLLINVLILITTHYFRVPVTSSLFKAEKRNTQGVWRSPVLC